MSIVFKRILKTVLLICIFMAAAGISTYITINLLIGSGSTVVVPDLEGKEIVYVLEMLSDLGLDIKVQGLEYNADVPKNHILSQDPEPGSEIKKGRDVRLVISKGAQAVFLPNLTGMSVPQARILLDENDLHLGVLSYTFSNKKPKEDILTQYPPPGTIGLRGNSVNLLVSTGARPRIFSMGDIKGLSLNAAIARLEKQGLTTGAIRSIHDTTKPNGTVLDQAPGNGNPVAAGIAVELTINRHKKEGKAIRFEGPTLFRYRTSEGFLRQQVRVHLNRPTTSIDLFNDFVKPGREIWLAVPNDEPGTLLLYIDDQLVKTEHYD